MTNCTKCLLPANVPGANVNEKGLCAFCISHKRRNVAREEQQRHSFELDLEEALKSCRGQGPYDCLVSFSGGKDSIYLLHKLKVKYNLRILAFTCDLDIPASGWDNIKRTIHALDVDHIIYRPSMTFYKKFFRYLLKNQSTEGAVKSVCYVSAPLTEGYALRLATDRKIPLVLTGYSPGQPDEDWMLYEMAQEKVCCQDWTPRSLQECGLFSKDELRHFWNPQSYPPGTRFPRFLAPFHAWKYHQSELMEKVVELGLVARRRNANPILTNSPFQWLLMYSDLKLLGYNPYAPEFCKLIRSGQANRTLWKILFPFVNFMIRRRILMGRNVTRTAEWLNLSLNELKISESTRSLHSHKRSSTITPKHSHPDRNAIHDQTPQAVACNVTK